MIGAGAEVRRGCGQAAGFVALSGLVGGRRLPTLTTLGRKERRRGFVTRGLREAMATGATPAIRPADRAASKVRKKGRGPRCGVRDGRSKNGRGRNVLSEVPGAIGGATGL